MKMPYPLCFPRALDTPVLDGRLKTEPEDFVVTEVLGFEPTGTGEHEFLLVEKRGANTAWVATGIARYANVRDFDVSYGGKKDRHAVTRQWFSCWLPGTASPDWSGLPLEGVRVLESTRHNKKLRRGMHEGNQFSILVRDVVTPSFDEVAFKARLDAIARHGFPNYFGNQRFGHEGNNLTHANNLLEGRSVSRSKRDIYLSAARSYLFNRMLSSKVASGSGWMQDATGQAPEGWLHGSMRRDNEALPVDQAFRHWQEALVGLGVKAMRRPLSVVPGDLRYQVDNTSLRLSFYLPSGAYATSLLRELVGLGGTEVLIEDDVLG